MKLITQNQPFDLTLISIVQVEENRRKEIIAFRDARKKKLRKLPPRKLGGIVRPSTPRNTTAPCLVPDLSKFLEEEKIIIEEFDKETQTDSIAIPEIPYPEVLSKIGYDVSTEILPWEMYNFEEEIEPVVKTLAIKVLEQSLLENCEEEELLMLRSQHNYYEEQRRMDQVRMLRVAQREQMMVCERERLMREMIAQRKIEEDLEEAVGARMFAKSYLKLMSGKMFENLEEAGFLQTVNVAGMSNLFKKKF